MQYRFLMFVLALTFAAGLTGCCSDGGTTPDAEPPNPHKPMRAATALMFEDDNFDQRIGASCSAPDEDAYWKDFGRFVAGQKWCFQGWQKAVEENGDCPPSKAKCVQYRDSFVGECQETLTDVAKDVSQRECGVAG